MKHNININFLLTKIYNNYELSHWKLLLFPLYANYGYLQTYCCEYDYYAYELKSRRVHT